MDSTDDRQERSYPAGCGRVPKRPRGIDQQEEARTDRKSVGKKQPKQEAQELTEAEQKLQEIQAKRAIIQRLRELKEAEERGEDIQEISESVEEESQEEELIEVRTAMDNYVDAIKDRAKRKDPSRRCKPPRWWTRVVKYLGQNSKHSRPP